MNRNFEISISYIRICKK